MNVAIVLMLAFVVVLAGTTLAWVNSIKWPVWKPDWCAPVWDEEREYDAANDTWNVKRVPKRGFNCSGASEQTQERRENQTECVSAKEC